MLILAIVTARPITLLEIIVKNVQKHSLVFLTVKVYDLYQDYSIEWAPNLTHNLHIYILECQCNEQGSASDKCEDESGKCSCRPHVVGHKCDKCEPGYFGFPDCQRMYCSIRHSIVSENLKLFFSKRYSTTHVVWGNFGRYFFFAICNVKYPWLIKSRFWNNTFVYLILFWFIYKQEKYFKIKISACECNDDGSRDISCDDDTGKCPCRTNIIGDKCTFCSPGFTGFPNCQGK